MNAKERLIDFLKKAPRAEGGTYTFAVHGDKEEASAYVHRMRVELSRFRNKLRERNRQVRPFKMLLQSIEPHYQNTDGAARSYKVTLQFQQSNTDHISRELSEVFDVVSTGDGTIDEKQARGLKNVENE